MSISRRQARRASLRVVVAAFLARFKGQSRTHTEPHLLLPDLRPAAGSPPLDARRAHVELYLRWMQEVARYKPATVSRRLSVVAGFYRTFVIDGVLEEVHGHRLLQVLGKGDMVAPRPLATSSESRDRGSNSRSDM